MENKTVSTNFYPRPPRGGRPAARLPRLAHSRYFYPRPPRGGRRLRFPTISVIAVISIHALREEGDLFGVLSPTLSRNFYPRPPRGGRRNEPCSMSPWSAFLSTPSARRATAAARVVPQLLSISIHALREEGDLPKKRAGSTMSAFLSTPSARRATRLAHSR